MGSRRIWQRCTHAGTGHRRDAQNHLIFAWRIAQSLIGAATRGHHDFERRFTLARRLDRHVQAQCVVIIRHVFTEIFIELHLRGRHFYAAILRYASVGADHCEGKLIAVHVVTRCDFELDLYRRLRTALIDDRRLKRKCLLRRQILRRQYLAGHHKQYQQQPFKPNQSQNRHKLTFKNAVAWRNTRSVFHPIKKRTTKGSPF